MPDSTYINKDNFNPRYQLHPAQLDEDERAQHVLNALLDYNRGIVQANPAGANAKIEKLKFSDFVFMRGTADLMYRDLRGTDANMATVLCMGDVHPENFGVMESESNKLIWALNDFDEASFTHTHGMSNAVSGAHCLPPSE